MTKDEGPDPNHHIGALGMKVEEETKIKRGRGHIQQSLKNIA